GQQYAPIWTPDGSRFAFASFVRGRKGALLWINPDGNGPAEPLTTMDVTGGTPVAWRPPDGNELVFVFDGSLWTLSRDRKTEPRQLVRGAHADFSPDGNWLAYSAEGQVWVQPYPALDRRVQVSTNGGGEPVWRRDGREMFYREPASADSLKTRIMAVPI